MSQDSFSPSPLSHLNVTEAKFQVSVAMMLKLPSSTQPPLRGQRHYPRYRRLRTWGPDCLHPVCSEARQAGKIRGPTLTQHLLSEQECDSERSTPLSMTPALRKGPRDFVQEGGSPKRELQDGSNQRQIIMYVDVEKSEPSHTAGGTVK